VLGREMHGLNKGGLIGVRRDIGFIFQSHNLLEAMTAEENVTLALDLKRYSRTGLHEHAGQLLSVLSGGGRETGSSPPPSPFTPAKLAAGLLGQLGLQDRAHHKPGQLSGGQKQRVAIARALVNHPRLILADEPTAALDKGSSRIVIDLLKRLTQAGSTVLVVTHDHRIMDRGDRIVNLEDGRIESNVLVDDTVRVCVFLQKVSLFAGLTPGRLVEFAAKVSKEVHPAGTPIIRQGEAGDRFYLVKEGKVDVVVEQGTSRRVITTLDAGEFFGEIALLEDRPRSATVVATEPVELYTVQKEDFLHARASFETMRDELMKVFTQRYRP
jgi:putative ABC transport system ATP-binding protein